MSAYLIIRSCASNDTLYSMLICYRATGQKSFKIGIAVKEWFIDTEPRIYVISPEEITQTCSVTVLYSPEYEWSIPKDNLEYLIFNTIELPSQLILIDPSVDKMLYQIWDENAPQHLEVQLRLYQYFQAAISQYTKEALKIRKYFFAKSIEYQIAQAKKNGWDTSTIHRLEIKHAFDSQDVFFEPI